MMTEDMLAAAGLHLADSDLQFVRELIDPSSYTSRSSAKLFLYDIVANARNSLDVDKVTLTHIHPHIHTASARDERVLSSLTSCEFRYPSASLCAARCSSTTWLATATSWAFRPRSATSGW